MPLTKSRRCSNLLTTPFCILTVLFSAIGSVYSSVDDLSLLIDSLISQPYTPRNTSTFMDEYDYIVVGAGSGGAVVASRLSEVPCVNVLLLEAGRIPSILTEIPIFFIIVAFTHANWQFKTAPQKYSALALKNRQIPATAGKLLGGGSNINAMMYVRGNKKDYDRWAAQGAEGWSYDEVLPYFLKLENNRDPDIAASVYHNTDGPVSAERPNYKSLFKHQFHSAIEELGYEILDSNAEKQAGFYDLQGNTRNGRRCSSAKAYLVPASKRSNFHIVAEALVKKIIIENQRAVGVEFDYSGKTYKVKATKEIIVSAGALKTPQLLMVSGVGPKEELEKFNIPVIADLPVGKNFHDHVMTTFLFEFGPAIVPFYFKLLNPANIVKYISEGSGPYAAIAFAAYLAFLRSNSTSQIEDDPNVQIVFSEITSAPPGILAYNLKPEVFDGFLKPYNYKPLMACLVMNIQPRSRGTVTLSSTNVNDPPVINPNYLGDPADYDSIVEGMKVCRRITQTKSMQKLGIKPLSTVMPGCEKYFDNEDSYYRCYLKHFTNTLYHYSGSAKMGDPRDPSTVLDSKLRVKNIAGLRVADASVMPQVTSGNTNIPVMMIGEKAADMIKETIDINEQCRNVNNERKIISPPIDTTAATAIRDHVKWAIKDGILIIKSFLEMYTAETIVE